MQSLRGGYVVNRERLVAIHQVTESSATNHHSIALPEFENTEQDGQNVRRDAPSEVNFVDHKSGHEKRARDRVAGAQRKA
jgi:hypothetical protein